MFQYGILASAILSLCMCFPTSGFMYAFMVVCVYYVWPYVLLILSVYIISVLGCLLVFFPLGLIITIHPDTPEPVNHSILFGDEVFIFGTHQKAFDGLTSFKAQLDPMFSNYFLET